MSTFSVSIIKIDGIEPIPSADSIELAKIADYRSVVRKGQFKQNDLAVYIPEGAVIPEWLLEHLGLVGKLAGSAKNRVKAIKLRGCLSQGILLDVEKGSTDERVLVVSEPHEGNQGAGIYKLGDDLAADLGITKYEPPVPIYLAGQVVNIGSQNTLKYDIENLKRHPNVITEGTEVQVSEKVHGTFVCFGYNLFLNNSEIFDSNKFVASKGLGAQGLVFKNNEKNTNNVYIKMFNNLRDNRGADIFQQLEDAYTSSLVSIEVQEILNPFMTKIEDRTVNSSDINYYKLSTPMYILGEIFGKGIQDLSYGLLDYDFRIFDIYLGEPGLGRYLNFNEMQSIAKQLNIKIVDTLYVGQYSREKMDELAVGKTITGNNSHIREGIVIKPTIESRHDSIGRVILKHINEAYLLRKNGTEFN